MHEVLESPGQPLDGAARRLEPPLGQDLARVRVHADPRAAASARAIGARGYATGDHVVLGDAATPLTLAHELAHVVQGGRRPSAGTTWRIAAPGDPLEAAAGVAAQRALSARPAGTVTTPAAPGTIYRQSPRDPGGPPPPPSVPRRIHIDTSVIDQLNRGTQDVAKQLKAWKQQGIELTISVPTEVELTLRGADPQIRAANRELIKDFGLGTVSGGADLAERVKVYEKGPSPGSPSKRRTCRWSKRRQTTARICGRSTRSSRRSARRSRSI